MAPQEHRLLLSPTAVSSGGYGYGAASLGSSRKGTQARRVTRVRVAAGVLVAAFAVTGAIFAFTEPASDGVQVISLSDVATGYDADTGTYHHEGPVTLPTCKCAAVGGVVCPTQKYTQGPSNGAAKAKLNLCTVDTAAYPAGQCVGSDYRPAFQGGWLADEATAESHGMRERFPLVKDDGSASGVTAGTWYAGCDVVIGSYDCWNFDCGHNGYGIDSADGCKCQCTPFWQGDLCDTDVAECSRPMTPAEADMYPCDLQAAWDATAGALSTTEFTSTATCTEQEGAYTCQCLDGFEGDGYSTTAGLYMPDAIFTARAASATHHGCTVTSPCTAGKCLHGGTCTDLIVPDKNLFEYAKYQEMDQAEEYPSENSFLCTCAPGWYGETCEKDINECDTSETKGPFDGTHRCLGGKAICTNTPGSYTCACVTGTGFQKGNERMDGWEGNGWDPAKQPEDAADRLGDPATYTGCTDVDDCAKYAPCMNGGSCTNGGNGDGSYACTCTSRWQGTDCETDLDECDPVNCAQNDGSACDLHMCHEDATCYNNPGSWICTCNNGWTGDGNTCIDADDCEPSPCANGGTCTDLGTLKYNCDCVIGWRGTNCGLDWNECTMGIHTCHNDAECLNNDGSFSCKCDVGFSGDGYAVCENVDDCWVYDTKITDASGAPRTARPNFPTTVSVCAHATNCKDEALGVFTCTCLGGWTDANCDVDVNECMEATLNTCDNNALCINLDGGTATGEFAGLGFYCTCNAGFSGTGQQGNCVDIDDCTKNGNPCAHGTCSDAGLSTFNCLCEDGWSDMLCDFDVNECIPTTVPSGDQVTVCDANAACTNTPGSFKCACNTGFTGDGIQGGVGCLDMDDCGSGPCEHGICTNSEIGESFECTCDAGWRDSQCDFDVNECYTAKHDCHIDGRCVNTIGGFYCRCSSGYEGDGYATTHVHDENTATSMFMERRCEDDSGATVTCQYIPQNTTEKNLHMLPVLMPGYKFLGYYLNTIHAKRDHIHAWEIEGTNAVGCIDLNDCDPMRDGLNEPDNPCYTDPNVAGVSRGTCEDLGQNKYQCNCIVGWNPDINNGGCEKDLDECELGTHACTPLWATCTNTQGSYTCACNSGYYTLSGIATDCLECVNCKGKAGYKIKIGCNVVPEDADPDADEPARLEEVCEDVNECDNEVADGQTFANNCDPDHGICTNTEGSFTCQCETGWYSTSTGVEGVGCSPCTTCKDGEYMAAECTPLTDRVCKLDVPTGMYLMQNPIKGDVECLRFPDAAGDARYPRLESWASGNPEYCGIEPNAGGTCPYWTDDLTAEDEHYKWCQIDALYKDLSAIFKFTHVIGFTYMIQATGSLSGKMDCLHFNEAGSVPGVFPELLGNCLETADPPCLPGRDEGNKFCNLPMTESGEGAFLARYDVQWHVVPLDAQDLKPATKFMIKSPAKANQNDDKTYLCLYFAKLGSGSYSTNPTRSSLVLSSSASQEGAWGHKAVDAKYCGIEPLADPETGEISGRAALLANKQAVWHLVDMCALAKEATNAGADPPITLSGCEAEVLATDEEIEAEVEASANIDEPVGEADGEGGDDAAEE